MSRAVLAIMLLLTACAHNPGDFSQSEARALVSLDKEFRHLD